MTAHQHHRGSWLRWPWNMAVLAALLTTSATLMVLLGVAAVRGCTP